MIIQNLQNNFFHYVLAVKKYTIKIKRNLKSIPPSFRDKPRPFCSDEAFVGDILVELGGVSVLLAGEEFNFLLGDSIDADLSNELCSKLGDFFNGGSDFLTLPAVLLLPRGGSGP